MRAATGRALGSSMFLCRFLVGRVVGVRIGRVLLLIGCFVLVRRARILVSGIVGGGLVQGDTVVGVVSFAKGCGHRSSPGVYVDVANEEIHEFVLEQMDK